MPYPATLDEICAALTERGCPALARRLAYFASDDDLEPGDVPLTLASALGFWDFFRRVDSEGRAFTGCSPEGWLCVEWDFDDQRGVSLWFLDDQQVRFAAKGADGQWVQVDGGNAGSLAVVAEKLVEAGLFQWHQETADGKNWQLGTMSPDTAGVGT